MGKRRSNAIINQFTSTK